jgi:hypothetical protein
MARRFRPALATNPIRPLPAPILYTTGKPKWLQGCPEARSRVFGKNPTSQISQNFVANEGVGSNHRPARRRGQGATGGQWAALPGRYGLCCRPPTVIFLPGKMACDPLTSGHTGLKWYLSKTAVPQYQQRPENHASIAADRAQQQSSLRSQHMKPPRPNRRCHKEKHDRPTGLANGPDPAGNTRAQPQFTPAGGTCLDNSVICCCRPALLAPTHRAVFSGKPYYIWSQ